jgi:hypothetical protein
VRFSFSNSQIKLLFSLLLPTLLQNRFRKIKVAKEDSSDDDDDDEEVGARKPAKRSKEPVRNRPKIHARLNPFQSQLYTLFILLGLVMQLACQHVLTAPTIEHIDVLIRRYLVLHDVVFPNKGKPNHHRLLHLKECMYRFGPLHAQWCYGFERFNEWLGSAYSNGRQVEQTFLRKLFTSRLLANPHILRLGPVDLPQAGHLEDATLADVLDELTDFEKKWFQTLLPTVNHKSLADQFNDSPEALAHIFRFGRPRNPYQGINDRTVERSQEIHNEYEAVDGTYKNSVARYEKEKRSWILELKSAQTAVDKAHHDFHNNVSNRDQFGARTEAIRSAFHDTQKELEHVKARRPRHPEEPTPGELSKQMARVMQPRFIPKPPGFRGAFRSIYASTQCRLRCRIMRVY